MKLTFDEVLFAVRFVNLEAHLFSFSVFLITLLFFKFRTSLARRIQWIFLAMVLLGALEAYLMAKNWPETVDGVVRWEQLDKSTYGDPLALPMLAVVLVAPVAAAIGLLCASLGLRRKEGIFGIGLIALSLGYFCLSHWIIAVLLD